MKRSLFIALTFMVVVYSLPTASQTQPPAKEKPQESVPPPSQKKEEKFVIKTNMVSVTVTVSDQNRRFVTGLEKKDFEVYDDKVEQDIALFSTQDSPLTLGIVYDVSGSMNPLSTQSFRALKGLFEYSHPQDEYFVISFSNRSKLIQDFTSVPEEIINKAVFIKPKGGTALFDGIYMALEKVKQGRHEKKALLIISDGEENSSRYSFKELQNSLRETDAQLYAIGLGAGGSLPQITQTSGGLTFFPQEYGEVADIYARIALMLRNQYVIGFYPTDDSGAKRRHKLKINVKVPKQLGKVFTFYRNGYEPSDK
jgi:Ca-activated chloride channel homolog